MWWRKRRNRAIGVAALLALAICTLMFAVYTPDIPRSILEARYATPQSRFLNLPDGARVHYHVRGPANAPTLVVLHGFMGSVYQWERWSVILSDRYRVISLDLPGHGLTGAVPSNDYSQAAMARFLKDFADGLHLQRFAIAGNSLGGDIAAHFTELYPERVDALILLDAAGAQTPTRPRRNLVARIAAIPLVSAIAAHLPPCWLFPVGFAWTPWNGCGDGPQWDLARMPGVRSAMFAHYQLPIDAYVWPHAREIVVPTLILWGEDDHTIPIASAYAWHRAIRGSQLITYPRVGHVPNLMIPVQSATDARRFLDAKITR